MNEIQTPVGQFKFIELFAGVGGFRLGIQRAIPHAECILTNEWDKHACATYSKNFEKLEPKDIRNINEHELPDFDCLVGGFPCQTFSIAGKRRGFEDTRGTMFFEVARILKAKKPRLVVLENVKGLLNHDKGQTFKVILETLGELGYDVQWMVLNSKFFGVPQNRERVFIIANLRGTSRLEILPFPKNHGQLTEAGEGRKTESQVGAIRAGYYKTPGDGTYIISHAPRCGDPAMGGTGLLSSSEHCFTLDTSPHYVAGTWRTHKDGEGFREIQDDISPCIPARARQDGSGQPCIAVLTPDRLEKRQNGRRMKEDGEEMFTLNTQDKHGIFNGSSIRRLTPLECERLQGFPDGWTEGVSDTQRYKQMGNAVTVNVIEALFRQIFKETKGVRD